MRRLELGIDTDFLVKHFGRSDSEHMSGDRTNSVNSVSLMTENDYFKDSEILVNASDGEVA